MLFLFVKFPNFNSFVIGAADDRKWAESDPVLYESPPHGEYNELLFSFWYLLVEPDTCGESPSKI